MGVGLSRTASSQNIERACSQLARVRADPDVNKVETIEMLLHFTFKCVQVATRMMRSEHQALRPPQAELQPCIEPFGRSCAKGSKVCLLAGDNLPLHHCHHCFCDSHKLLYILTCLHYSSTARQMHVGIEKPHGVNHPQHRAYERCSQK